MSNISVAEILKIHGKWIEGKPFAEFVAQKKRISKRHAYNLIKEASENHEILRLPLPNRTVLYGLSEFGPPKFEPSTEQKPSPKSFGFFGLLERRAERKRLEKERRILDLNIEFYALREEILMDENKYNSEAPEQHARRRQKYRKILEGSQKN